MVRLFISCAAQMEGRLPSVQSPRYRSQLTMRAVIYKSRIPKRVGSGVCSPRMMQFSSIGVLDVHHGTYLLATFGPPYYAAHQ